MSTIFSNISILVVGILGLALVVLLTKNENPKVYMTLTVIFSISVALMLILYYGYFSKYTMPYYLGGSDDLSFEQSAEYILQRGYKLPHELKSESQFYYHSAKGFLWLLSWLMKFCNIFGGYHTIVYRILNIYFLLALGILVFKYFSKHYYFSQKQNLVVLCVTTLFPNAQFISIHVFRDTLNILILFSIFYMWDNYLSKVNAAKISLILSVCITMILSYVSFWIRTQNLIFIIVIILLSLFLKHRSLTKKTVWLYSLGLIIILLAFSYLDVFNEITKFNEYYTDYLLTTNDGISQKVFAMNLIPYGIFVRIIFGLISPLPVAILKLKDMFIDIDTFFKVLVSIGSIAQIYLLPYLISNLKRIDKVVIMYLTFLFATVITTFTFRHFIMLYPFMFILIFRQFFESTKQTKILLFISMTMTLALTACIYILVK
ncbi:hypothetical protein ACFWMP_28310 [Paenibacillus sp. NPDC058367]|uniref:hypothetical protein n=1 Tax=Paenibacillus sp. NPDC058367 TaxID=3346460 RepID=UPI003666011B